MQRTLRDSSLPATAPWCQQQQQHRGTLLVCGILAAPRGAKQKRNGAGRSPGSLLCCHRCEGGIILAVRSPTWSRSGFWCWDQDAVLVQAVAQGQQLSSCCAVVMGSGNSQRLTEPPEGFCRLQVPSLEEAKPRGWHDEGAAWAQLWSPPIARDAAGQHSSTCHGPAQGPDFLFDIFL